MADDVEVSADLLARGIKAIMEATDERAPTMTLNGAQVVQLTIRREEAVALWCAASAIETLVEVLRSRPEMLSVSPSRLRKR